MLYETYQKIEKEKEKEEEIMMYELIPRLLPLTTCHLSDILFKLYLISCNKIYSCCDLSVCYKDCYTVSFVHFVFLNLLVSEHLQIFGAFSFSNHVWNHNMVF